MIKRILLPIVVGILLGLGLVWLGAVRNTPERTGNYFVRELAAGNVDAAYARLSGTLTKGRERYWKDYLKQFTTTTEPEVVRSEQIVDAANTYTSTNDPHRLTYEFELEDRGYQLTLVTVKAGGAWVIDNLYGSDAR